jgi:hypothetical protein
MIPIVLPMSPRSRVCPYSRLVVFSGNAAATTDVMSSSAWREAAVTAVSSTIVRFIDSGFIVAT